MSFPMVGLAAIDSSYTYSGASAMSCGMMAIWLAITAYTEYTAQMEGKVFAMYHYFLSANVLFWQLQPSTSMLGAAFFSAPHLFTSWTVYILVTKDKTA